MSTHDQVLAEKDNPKNLVIFGGVFVIGAFFLTIAIGITQFFGFAIREELDRKVYSQPSAQLRQARASEQEKLNRYQWVDKQAGVVRVPLDTARELTLRDWANRKQGLVGAGGAAVEETVEGAAPSTEEAP